METLTHAIVKIVGYSWSMAHGIVTVENPRFATVLVLETELPGYLACIREIMLFEETLALKVTASGRLYACSYNNKTNARTRLVRIRAAIAHDLFDSHIIEYSEKNPGTVVIPAVNKPL